MDMAFFSFSKPVAVDNNKYDRIQAIKKPAINNNSRLFRHFLYMVGSARFELATYGLRVRCSTS